MPPLIRYLLLQVPGWALLAGLLWWIVANGYLRPSAGATIFVFWLVKDALLYPAFRRAIGPAPAIDGKAMVGREGALVRTAAPTGRVRLGGELWAVRARHGQRIEAGVQVRVVDAKGLVLVVEPVDEEGARSLDRRQ